MRNVIFSTRTIHTVFVGITTFFLMNAPTVEATVCSVAAPAPFVDNVDPSVVIGDSPLALSVARQMRFQRLISKWHAERSATSSATSMAMCPAYQGIIG